MFLLFSKKDKEGLPAQALLQKRSLRSMEELRTSKIDSKMERNLDMHCNMTQDRSSF